MARAPRRRRPGRRSSAWIRPEKRYAIYERDGFVCVWCGTAALHLTLDHLFPRGSRWNDNDPRRLVTSCVSCNTARRHTRLRDWLRTFLLRGLLDGVCARLRRARQIRVDRAFVAEVRTRRSAPLPDVPPEHEHLLGFDGAVY
jgi:hypothetical protein